MTNEQQFSRLRTQLLLQHPFFGQLAMELIPVPDDSVGTACTDGVKLWYSPKFLFSLPDPEQLGVVAHEVMHPALLHTFRRGGRDNDQWNDAADYAINPLLIDAGIHLPAGVLYDPQYFGMSAEQIYSMRAANGLGQKQPPQQSGDQSQQGSSSGQPQQGQSGSQSGRGQGQPQKGTGPGEQGQVSSGAGPGSNSSPSNEPSGPGSSTCPTGKFIDAPPQPVNEPGSGDQPGQGMTEQDWQIAVEQATRAASGCGEHPGQDIARAMEATREPQLDWVAYTREFIVHTIASNHSWTSPNRRFMGRGLYLPGTVKDNVGGLVFVVDTSGSVSKAMLDDCAVQMQALLSEARPEYIDVVYCDAAVRSTQRFTPDDLEIKLEAKGGGGTRFQPAFNWVEQQGEQPVACIFFTDLENGSEVVAEPSYPVLWLTPEWVSKKGKFGETISIPEPR